MSILISKYRTHRVLIDLGGDSTADGGVSDTGVQTPDNTIGTGNLNGRTGQAGDGKWWNNIVDCRTGLWISSPIDINNRVISGFSITADKAPRGTFSATDYSMNFGGYTGGAVSDYPVSAVRDNCYFHSSAGTVSLTFVVPVGKKATVKFWGNRAVNDTRILQVKKSTDGSYTQEYNSANSANGNLDYNVAATLTDLIGTVVVNAQVKSGSTFGHLSVIDMTFTNV